MTFIYIDEAKRRKELEQLTREELVTLILEAEEAAMDAHYEAMGEDL